MHRHFAAAFALLAGFAILAVVPAQAQDKIVTTTQKVWRFQADQSGASMSAQAFLHSELVEKTGGKTLGRSDDISISRSMTAADRAKTIIVKGKTYTVGEIMDVLFAIPLQWAAEDAAAATIVNSLP